MSVLCSPLRMYTNHTHNWTGSGQPNSRAYYAHGAPNIAQNSFDHHWPRACITHRTHMMYIFKRACECKCRHRGINILPDGNYGYGRCVRDPQRVYMVDTRWRINLVKWIICGLTCVFLDVGWVNLTQNEQPPENVYIAFSFASQTPRGWRCSVWQQKMHIKRVVIITICAYLAQLLWESNRLAVENAFFYELVS